jgi:hypothetical protein
MMIGWVVQVKEKDAGRARKAKVKAKIAKYDQAD